MRFTGAVMCILCLGMMLGTTYAKHPPTTQESLYMAKEENMIPHAAAGERAEIPGTEHPSTEKPGTEKLSAGSKEKEQEIAEGTKENLPDDWNLILVNQTHPVPTDYKVELKEIGSGHQIDVRIYEDYRAMIRAAKEEGIYLYVTSSYRDMDKQTALHEKKIESYVMQGYSYADAREMAARVVAVPGTSEHHLGLALDFVSSEYKKLDEKQETTKSFQWLKEHCAEYGFILRYPNGKTEITGIIYEPWHFRYVGKEAAAVIMEAGITLEEYLGAVPGS